MNIENQRRQKKMAKKVNLGSEKMLLDVVEAANLLGISRSHLDKLRAAGLGPRYIKLNGLAKGKNTRVFYSRQALLEWIDNQQIETA